MTIQLFLQWSILYEIYLRFIEIEIIFTYVFSLI